MKNYPNISSIDLTTYKRLLRAKEFMDAHFMKPICLSEISQNAFFSTYHFIRLFKKTYHITPHKYLIKRRIEKAKQLFLNHELTITTICYIIGFESLGSFSILFKKHTGYSPLEYKLRLLARQTAAEHNPQILIPGCFVYTYITDKK
jgi:AraC-like DNA-binding protein